MSLVGLIMLFLCLQVSYEHWEEIDAKQENLEKLLKIQTTQRFYLRASEHQELGFRTPDNNVRAPFSVSGRPDARRQNLRVI